MKNHFGSKPDGSGGRHPFLSVQYCVEQHRGHSSRIACRAWDFFFGVYTRAISSYKPKGHEYLGIDNLYINAINPSARAFGFIIEAYVTWRRHTAC